jgi:hypothetical protein
MEIFKMSKKKDRDYKTFMVLGQNCLIFGVLGSRLVRIVLGDVILAGSAYARFFQVFMDGITVILLVVALFFTMKGLLLYKKCRVKNPTYRSNHRTR